MKLKLHFAAVCAALVCGNANAITPNPLLSRGLTARTSAGDNTYITDGTLTNWKQCTAKDIALNVGEGPTRLFVTWESYGDCAWATNFTNNCGHNGTPLKNFSILTSANSTNGQDGDWEEVATIENNPVMSRGVFIDFEGKSWFRFFSEENVGEILEIEAFDISNGGDDTWFFMGTSISQMGLKQQETDSTTADILHARFPNYTPAMLRGGIGCINSTEVVAHLSDYLKYAGNVKHWAIEMGTNDCWGGGDWNLDNFRKNMQTIIDSAKAHGIEPVIARIIATDSAKAGWQVNPKYLDLIDELTETNNLHPGPDFYTYFKEHDGLHASDGVHPNGENGGGQAMHHLWAEALAPLYRQQETQPTDTTTTNSELTSSSKICIPRILVYGKSLHINGLDEDIANVTLISPQGAIVEQHLLTADNPVIRPKIEKGTYMVVVRTSRSCVSTKVVLQ